MKILHVINDLSKGGAEKLLTELLPVLHEGGGLELELLLISSSKNVDSYLESIRSTGIKISMLGLNIYSIFKVCSAMKLFLTRNKYDIVHVHLFPSFYYVSFVWLLLRDRPKLFYTEHSTQNKRSRTWYGRLIDSLIYRNYTKITAISDDVRKHLIARGIPERKVITIENGIELPKTVLSLNESFLHRIGMVGRFNAPKQQSIVISALKFLPAHIELYLAGEGKDKEDLVKLATEIGVIDRVHFYGFVENISNFFSTIDIHVLSSKWEGFGLSALESMSLGIPTIASDVPGLNSVVSQGGLLFNEGNVNDLVAKINMLYGSRELYLEISKQGIKKSKIFSIEETGLKLKDLYLKEYICVE